ncbi:MAG: M3 family oligoendopeptidase [Chloroflexi bacterium]|nr:M3 family oligoendopeptidase [Chloroflexota bacterium]
MNFKSLPTEGTSILAMTWQEYLPYYNDLESRKLDDATVDSWLDDWSALASCIDEQYTRLQVVTSQHTADEGLKKQFDGFLDQTHPAAKSADQGIKQKLLASGLHPKGFEVALKMMQTEADLFCEANLPLLAEQQKLCNEYDKIMGATTVMWEGEEKTYWQMYTLYSFETDRAVRERAYRAIAERIYQNRDPINDLWSRFMELRRNIAQNAGYSDFRSYMWKQKFRFDYTPEDCKSFHAAIEQVVVPAAQRIYARRQKRLGIEATLPWDREVDQFGRAMLRPAESMAELNARTLQVFGQVDPKFREYYQAMMDHDLLDLESRKNKASGGYSVAFNVARLPFIFMNRTNTAVDVIILLHEGGHAFHTFKSAHWRFHQRAEAYVPVEFSEVASMSMELIASPYLTRAHGGYYTEEESARSRISHMETIILFWPYIALVDAFQHWIYENHAEASDGRRCEEKWSELWDRFMQGIDYRGFERDKGIYWHQQGHIHTTPFYYVEYGLAQLGAVQVFGRARKDQKRAVAVYRKALSLGSTRPLPELFAAAGAKFAFDAHTLKQAVDLLEEAIEEQEAHLS